MQDAQTQLAASYLPDGSTHPILRRLAANQDYGLFPRGVVDGSGKLAVLYLDRIRLGFWAWRFRRFRRSGRRDTNILIGWRLPWAQLLSR